MKNSEIAHLLNIMAVYEEMSGKFFQARAYEKSARSIESLTEEASDIFRRGGIEALMEIPGVGEGIAKKIVEMIKEGKSKHLEDLKKKVPVDVENLISVPGIGPKKIMMLYKKMKIKNVDDLERAAKSGKIRELPRFGEKSEQDILKGIEFFRKSKGRFLLGYILPLIEAMAVKMKSIDGVKESVVAGSARRRKETIGDADFLVTSTKPQKIIQYFVKMPEVEHVYAKGDTKAMVKLRDGIDADLRVVPLESFGAAIQYFTGNKDHNVALRKMAISKGWKLSEYGIFDKKGKQIAGRTEEDVYDKLGMKWIPPEMRENTGEIEAAMKGDVPKLIGYGELKGDMQVQTNWTDGSNSIKEMAEAARKMELEYIVITDHTKSLGMTGGLDEKGLERQGLEIEKINKSMKDFSILRGAEVNILKDGKLDIKDSELKKLDVVGAAVHSAFGLKREEQTKRVIKAIENPNIDILFHPTGRVIHKRDPYDIDMEAVIDAAKETGTILEIDSFPDRLDLKDEHIRLGKKRGCMFSIDSDAHAIPHLKYTEFGVAQARRGWLQSKDVINTLSSDRMLKKLKG